MPELPEVEVVTRSLQKTNKNHKIIKITVNNRNLRFKLPHNFECVLKNKIVTKITSCKTVREHSGVACSSRNSNLNKNQMKIAKDVFNYLIKMKKKTKKNLKLFDSAVLKKDLIKIGVNKIDYLEIINQKTLEKPKKSKENFNIFIAYHLDKVRLIDNI